MNAVTRQTLTKTLAVLIAAAVTCGTALRAWGKDAEPPPAPDTPATTSAAQTAEQPAGTAKRETETDAAKIQMAILLDCSGSMSGLINQARTQLWRTVNEFAKARHNGKPVLLEVALYEYGSNNYPAEQGYLKQLVPLTDDLDRISEALFALKTSGSQEYCGQVIDTATRELKWSDSPQDMKCIFIAGNEPFTQGPVDFRKACQSAISKEITVNTIHCGDEAAGISGMWRDGALLADGSFMTINQNQQIVAIAAPQDKELVRLNSELNKTYIAYGSAEARKRAQDRQIAQDSNAANSNAASLSSRVAFKAQAQYRNSAWDIVDACREGKIKLEDLKESELPEELKKLKPAERKAYVEKVAANRLKIQEQIKQLSVEREKFVAEARKEQADEAGNTLDEAVITAARKQAAAKKYTFPE